MLVNTLEIENKIMTRDCDWSVVSPWGVAPPLGRAGPTERFLVEASNVHYSSYKSQPLLFFTRATRVSVNANCSHGIKSFSKFIKLERFR